jgi:transglutaminase-like putative cysteine protease
MSADYYSAHGEFTAVGEHGALFEALPPDVAGLCRTVQDLLIHDHSGLHLYGPPPASFHQASRETVPVSRRIDKIMAAHGQPITDARSPFERTVGTCRDFFLMLCAMLRQQGIAARVR